MSSARSRPTSDVGDRGLRHAHRCPRRPVHSCINDEGHHTHDEDSEWNKVIRRLHDELPSWTNVGQLDFSATPRYAKGGLFTWTVYDYPLKQAIIDNVVKRPMKGMTAGIKDQPSDIASVKYRAYLTAGVERWREYRDQLEAARQEARPLRHAQQHCRGGRRRRLPARQVPRGVWRDRLRRQQQLLVIHTDRSGEVSQEGPGCGPRGCPPGGRGRARSTPSSAC